MSVNLDRNSILPKKRTKLTILSIFFTQDSEYRLFFGRIGDTIICFRDCLTLNHKKYLKKSAQLFFVLFFPEVPAKAAAPVKTITCSTCVAKDPLSFVAFASDDTLERHQVKVHGAEPSEKLKKIMEEEKKAEEDELDVMDMDDGGMDFGSDSEDEVVPLPVINKPSIGAGKMAAIKANMAKAVATGNKIRLKSHRKKTHFGQMRGMYFLCTC